MECAHFIGAGVKLIRIRFLSAFYFVYIVESHLMRCNLYLNNIKMRANRINSYFSAQKLPLEDCLGLSLPQVKHLILIPSPANSLKKLRRRSKNLFKPKV
jgi:hypothetical protein